VAWGLNPLARPETLSVQDFVTLANGIAANG
jgi:16S rRNA (adenine1518-N6/adenine1519-N6)-dimethyltransferase